MNESTSPSRARLADLHRQRDAASAALQTLAERSNRLARLPAAVPAIEAELSRFDSEAAAAMRSWAENGGDSMPPVADTGKRAEIAERLAAARSQDVATAAAQSALAAEGGPHQKTVGNISPWITQAAGLVLANEVEALLPSLTDAIKAADKIRRRIEAGREIAYAAARSAPADMGRPLMVELERVSNAIRAAMSPAPDGIVFAANGEWNALTHALASDANASLESINA